MVTCSPAKSLASGLICLAARVLDWNTGFQEFLIQPRWPRAKLLSGRGVMEYHLPSVLGKKRRFYVESWGGVLTTIKHQSKTEPRSPPALVVARVMPRADRLSGRGSIGHSHPTHLKVKT